MRDLKNRHNNSINKNEPRNSVLSSKKTFANKDSCKKMNKQNSKLKYSAHNFFNKLSQQNREQNFSLQKFKEASQDYQQRTENLRMLKRIIFPKRDKIILNSIAQLNTLYNGFNCSFRAKSCHFSKKHCKESSNLQQKRIKQQNSRMAKRIINVRSVFKRKSIQDRKKSINYGVKYFLHSEVELMKPQLQEKMQIKNVYGYGPTIIQIISFDINCVPSLKQDDLISMQLLLSKQFLKQREVNYQYQTHGLEYKLIKNHAIKFAVSMKNIGQYVPLKFWKFNGINSLQIGICDIKFSEYLQKKQENFANDVFVQEKFEGHLRTTKNQQSQNSIKIKYRIHTKKYRHL